MRRRRGIGVFRRRLRILPIGDCGGIFLRIVLRRTGEDRQKESEGGERCDRAGHGYGHIAVRSIWRPLPRIIG